MKDITYTCTLKSHQGQILQVGGNAPIRVQAMTSTDTVDDVATAIQIKELVLAGAEMVRVTVNNLEAAQAIARICNRLERMSVDVPIIGDFHYNGHILLNEVPDCAQLLAKYRINPGNVGMGEKHQIRFKQIIDLAVKYDKPVRIGVNWGSLDEDKLAKLMDENQKSKEPLSSQHIMMQTILMSALDSATLAISYGMNPANIILSCKVSIVQDLISLYRQLSEKCRHPLHLGLTEAGMGIRGIVASTSALAILLQEGIGDTIRISLTPQPGESRNNEVLVAKEILQSLGIRKFHPTVVSCPGCGRTSSTRFQELAKSIDIYLKDKMLIWREKYSGVENLKIAIMGCIVNGPGESKQADIGISLPGSGEELVAPVYIKGQKFCTLRGDNIAQEFQDIIENFVKIHFQELSCAQ